MHVRILQVAEVVSTTEYQLRLRELQYEEAAAAAAAAAEAAQAALQAAIDTLQKVRVAQPCSRWRTGWHARFGAVRLTAGGALLAASCNSQDPPTKQVLRR